MSHKLAEFIRARREAVTPAMAGLPGGGRRRTPGLRREELAQLCDVSPTWLTWLEQGRPVSASSRMLARLAQVLQLSAAERGYLFDVADKADPEHGEAAGGGAAAGELAAIVAAIDAPAYMLDRQWNAVAWNAGGGRSVCRLARCAAAGVSTESAAEFAAFHVPVAAGARADRRLARARAAPGGRVSRRYRPPCGPGAAGRPDRANWPAPARSFASGGARSRCWAAMAACAASSIRVQGPLSFNQVTLHLARQHEVKLVMLLPVLSTVAAALAIIRATALRYAVSVPPPVLAPAVAMMTVSLLPGVALPSHNPNLRSIYAMLAAAGLFSLMDTAMKLLSETYPAMQVTALRALSSLPLVCLYLLYRGAFKNLLKVRWPLHCLRGALGVAMITLFAYGLKRLSLAEAYSLFFIAPLLITALSVFILKERVDLARWCAIAVGLGGVLVVLRPEGGEFLVAGRPGRAGRGRLLCRVGHHRAASSAAATPAKAWCSG